jgi:alpha-tubulin suppressor-like RCC1 family protein
MITGSGYTCTPHDLFSFAVGSVPSSSCWGDNSVGQLGNGTTINSAAPVVIAGGLNIYPLSASAFHACGVGAGINANTTTTYCWGDNGSGQLGNGTTISSATPVAVAGGLDFVSTVSAGSHHTCAVRLSYSPVVGAVYCWGDNSSGQLGNSWTTTSSVPVNVAGEP